MSGVTSRTLRYYDEIGLLRPARVGSNGYRYYDREQLLRLQQILLLRELGLDLTTIGKVVDAQHDPLEALRRHHLRLLDERGRLDRLVATVAATVKHLEEGTDMPAEHIFEGFEMSREYLDETGSSPRRKHRQHSATRDFGDPGKHRRMVRSGLRGFQRRGCRSDAAHADAVARWCSRR